MAIMGVNVQLHMRAGLLLLAAYLLVLIVGAVAPGREPVPGLTMALTACSALTAAEAFARPRPRIHGLDATTTLRDFAIVTFDVDPDRLAARVAGRSVAGDPDAR